VARHPKIEPEEALKLRQKGMTYAEIAEESGLTVSGVQQLFRVMGRVSAQTTHKDAVPWTLAKNHRSGKVAVYLRRLDSIAQGKRLAKGDKPNEWAINGVLRWANGLVDQGMDVSYDRETPPSEFSPQGGFFLISEDPETSHVRGLLARATMALTRKVSGV
jgi:hypothetical protein